MFEVAKFVIVAGAVCAGTVVARIVGPAIEAVVSSLTPSGVSEFVAEAAAVKELRNRAALQRIAEQVLAEGAKNTAAAKQAAV